MTDQTPKSQGSSSLDDLKTLRKQWFIEPLAERPQPAELYHHRKHKPIAGQWHQYRIVGIVSPPERSSMLATTNSPLHPAIHTETHQRHRLISCRNKIYADPSVEVLHVAYENTLNSFRYIRPLSEFMDGQFQLVT